MVKVVVEFYVSCIGRTGLVELKLVLGQYFDRNDQLVGLILMTRESTSLYQIKHLIAYHYDYLDTLIGARYPGEDTTHKIQMLLKLLWKCSTCVQMIK